MRYRLLAAVAAVAVTRTAAAQGTCGGSTSGSCPARQACCIISCAPLTYACGVGCSIGSCPDAGPSCPANTCPTTLADGGTGCAASITCPICTTLACCNCAGGIAPRCVPPNDAGTCDDGLAPGQGLWDAGDGGVAVDSGAGDAALPPDGGTSPGGGSDAQGPAIGDGGVEQADGAELSPIDLRFACGCGVDGGATSQTLGLALAVAMRRYRRRRT